MKIAWLILWFGIGVVYLGAHTQNQIVEQAVNNSNFQKKVTPKATATPVPTNTPKATDTPDKNATLTTTATATPTATPTVKAG
jgi:hypothetical protein